MTRSLMLLTVLSLAPLALVAAAPAAAITPQVVRDARARLLARHGNAEAFLTFCQEGLLTEPDDLAATSARLERVLETVSGHLHEVRRELLTPEAWKRSALDQPLPAQALLEAARQALEEGH